MASGVDGSAVALHSTAQEGHLSAVDTQLPPRSERCVASETAWLQLAGASTHTHPVTTVLAHPSYTPSTHPVHTQYTPSTYPVHRPVASWRDAGPIQPLPRHQQLPSAASNAAKAPIMPQARGVGRGRPQDPKAPRLAEGQEGWNRALHLRQDEPTGHKSQVTSHQSQVARSRGRVRGYEARVASHRREARARALGVHMRRLPSHATQEAGTAQEVRSSFHVSQKSQVTSHKSQATGHSPRATDTSQEVQRGAQAGGGLTGR